MASFEPTPSLPGRTFIECSYWQRHPSISALACATAKASAHAVARTGRGLEASSHLLRQLAIDSANSSFILLEKLAVKAVANSSFTLLQQLAVKAVANSSFTLLQQLAVKAVANPLQPTDARSASVGDGGVDAHRTN